MIKRLLTICFLLLAPHSALSAPLIGDLSNYRIDIDSSFNGTRLFLFGARNDNGDVVVVVRGPHKNYMVRKKEPVAGIWVNRERMKFFDVPDFYAIAASKPLDSIDQSNLFRQLGIGEQHLLAPPPDPGSYAAYEQFSSAFLRQQRQKRLYHAQQREISFMGETLFKTVIEFPDNIPPGKYTAEIYLISDGEVVGMQSTPIRINKSGLDAFLYSYAHEYPALYGITAVILALGVGWFTGRLFEKM